jgi:SanA protein
MIKIKWFRFKINKQGKKVERTKKTKKLCFKRLPRFRRLKLRQMLTGFLILIITGMLGSLFINIAMIQGAKKYIYTDINKIPAGTTVLVLGSQIRGTSLSPVLQDRVTGGIALMEAGKGRKLLLSGDHGQHYYDEVNAMRLYVLANAPDIAPEDIFLDHAGFSTWDSMYRARDVFEVQDLIIVTQQFHISRAVCMARSLGLNASGYAVDQEKFNGRILRYWKTREYFARIKAVLSIIFRVHPKYLGDKIPITGNGQDTWI